MMNRKRDLYGDESQTNSEIMNDNFGNNKHLKMAATSADGISPVHFDVLEEVGVTDRSQPSFLPFEEKQNLHAVLKAEIAKLCKILKLSEIVVRIVQRLLDHFMAYHNVNKEDTHLLQAFQMSLCWMAADMLGQTIDRNGSLLESRKILNFECPEDLVHRVYKKLKLLRKTYSKPLKNVVLTIDVAQKQWKLRRVQRHYEKRVLRLRQMHEERIHEVKKSWKEKRERLVEEHNAELVVFSDIRRSPSAIKTDKLFEGTIKFSSAIRDLECSMEWERRALEKKHADEMGEERRECENWLATAEANYGSCRSATINEIDSHTQRLESPNGSRFFKNGGSATIAPPTIIATEVIGCNFPTPNEPVTMQVGTPVHVEQCDTSNVFSQYPMDFAFDEVLSNEQVVNGVLSPNRDNEVDLGFLENHGSSLREDVPLTRVENSVNCVKPLDLKLTNASDMLTTGDQSVPHQNPVVSPYALDVSDDYHIDNDLQPLDYEVDGEQFDLCVNILDSHTSEESNQRLTDVLLQRQFEKMSKEKEQVSKLHEDTKSQLDFDFEKELQEMYARLRDKYAVKVMETDKSFHVTKTEIDANYNKFVMNKLLAQAFISSGSSDLVQPGAPSGSHVASSSSHGQPATVNPVYSFQPYPDISLSMAQPVRFGKNQYYF